jgi:outer membrane protein assembly factor BamE
MKTLFNWLTAAALLLGVSACSQMPTASRFLSTNLSPYKVDVLQGNVITAEQVAALRVGMGRDQVIAVLGTPLLQSVFHANRWDYVFSFQRQGEPVQNRHLSVFFDGATLARFEGDAMPKETEFVESIARPSKTVDPATLKASAPVLADFAKKNPPPPTVDAPSAPAQTQYPPLQTDGGLLQ